MNKNNDPLKHSEIKVLKKKSFLLANASVKIKVSQKKKVFENKVFSKNKELVKTRTLNSSDKLTISNDKLSYGNG